MAVDKQVLTLDINGRDQDTVIDGSETLLEVVREKLRLTGCKRGCDQGVCGACTVLIDGQPMRGCLLLAAACEGAPDHHRGRRGQRHGARTDTTSVSGYRRFAVRLLHVGDGFDPNCLASPTTRARLARKCGTPCRATCAGARVIRKSSMPQSKSQPEPEL